MNNLKKLTFSALSLAVAFSLFQSSALGAPASPPAQTSQDFPTPQAALAALKSALSGKSLGALRKIFGPGLTNLINPDLVQATNEFATAAAAFAESNRLVSAGAKRMVIEYGPEATPFAVPLVENAGRWSFDTDAGADELINRRIGRNELFVLDFVRTYVQAQREYASADRDGDGVLEYAQKFGSTPGSKDGLYWPRDLDGSLSPLGPLVAEAHAEGYRKSSSGREPFHGYYFRILTRQGKRVPGGAYDYVINGNMIGGFALIAWPAEYGETGVMTFIVNQQGRVYQKDLGSNTGRIASSAKGYDLDSTWTVSAD